MRRCLLVVAACTFACGAPVTEAPPEGASPGIEAPAPAAPVPDAPPIYSFRTDGGGLPPSGIRVLDDGRVQVLDPATGAWQDDRPLPPATLEGVRELLASERLGELPDRLPISPNALETAPRATWELRTPQGARTLVAERWSGLRVPALEKIHRALLVGRPADDITTTWTLAFRDAPVHLPCAPMQTRALRLVASRLLDPAAEEIDEPLGEQLLRIDWTNGQETWSTVVDVDGRVLRLQPTGAEKRLRLPSDTIAWLAGHLPEVAWDDPEALCQQRR